MASARETAEVVDHWTPKGRATRARIVECTAELMHRQGVAATATEDVLRAAKISNSQLYHYFADKRDLTRAVVAHQVGRVLDNQEGMLGGLDSWEALESWCDALIAYTARPGGQLGCPMGSLASELAERDEPSRVALAAGLQRWEAAIRAGLEAMRKRGVLRDDADPGHLALATLAALQGGLLLTQARRDSAPLRCGLDAALGYIRTFAA